MIGVGGRWGLWWVAAAAIAAGFVAFGVTGYGSVHVDANYLTLPAVAWASGLGFVNPIFPTAQEFDPQGIGRFLYHGPGFQILLRAFLHPPTGPQALLIIQSINALNVVLFAWFVRRIVRSSPWAAQPAARLAAVAALLSFGAVLMAAVGRPETLAITLVLFAAHLLLLQPARTSHDILRTGFVGVVLGWLAVTHPLNGLEAGLILALWYGWHRRPRAALLHLATAGTVALVVSLGVLAFLFPFPVADWMVGMRAHAGLLATFVDLRIVRFFLLDTRHPALGLTVAAAVVLSVLWWWRNRTIVSSPWIVTLAAALLAVIAARTSLFVAFRVYDTYPIFPVLSAGLLLAVGNVRAPWIRWVIVSILALPAVGFGRSTLLYKSYLTGGMSLAEARAAFERVLAEEPGPVAVTKTMWLLTEDYERLRSNFSLTNVEYRTGNPFNVVAVQQYQYASVDSLPGYRLIRSYRRPGVPTIVGFPLAWSVPGYQFDVYRLVQTAEGKATGLLDEPPKWTQSGTTRVDTAER